MDRKGGGKPVKEYFFVPVYRCRLCGAIFDDGLPTCKKPEAARKELLDSAFFYNRAKKQLPVLSPELYTVHHCIDGNYGIADLRGVRKLIEGGGFDG